MGRYIATSDFNEARAQLRKERKNQVRLGKTVTLERPVIGANLDSYYGDWKRWPAKTLLDVNEQDAGPGDIYPGSWVMTISGRIVDPSGIDPGDNPMVPAIAIIEYGTGGISNIVEVDAWRNVIGIPADVVRVSLAYTQLTNRDTSPGINPHEYFAKVEFTGTMAKTLETGAGIPTRSYRVTADEINPILTSFIPIPPMAHSWCWITPFEVTAGKDLGRFQVGAGGAGGGPSATTIENISKEVVESMSRMHCFRPLPAGANQLTWYPPSDEPSAASGGLLIFRISL